MKSKPPVMRGQKNNYIAKRKAISDAILYRERDFTRQFMIDAAVLAVHRTFGAGQKRIQDFYADMHDVLMEMASLTHEDYKGDKNLVYMKAKIDEALEPLLGDLFKPYDERYGG